MRFHNKLKFGNNGEENSEIIIKFMQIADNLCIFKKDMGEKWKGLWSFKTLNAFLIAKCINELDTQGIKLVKWCVNFLLLLSNPKIQVKKFQKKTQDKDYVEYKYICLWSFIYDFLQIPKDSGFDYILMEFLKNQGIIEYGCTIRCAYFKHWIDNPYKTWRVSEEEEDEIIKWAENAPDNI